MREVADRFVDGLVAGAKRLTVGDPLSWDTEVGPMVSGDQLQLVRELVDDAVARGRDSCTAAGRSRSRACRGPSTPPPC